MDYAQLISALILGIVEGLTEFIPVSSTGHLIIIGDLLNFGDTRDKVFMIVIQLGAIFAVMWEFRVKLSTVLRGLVMREPAALRFTGNVLVALLPAVGLGLLFYHGIKTYLFNPYTVALALILGGLAILWVEKKVLRPHIKSIEDLCWQDALKVGFAQSVSMFPGVSRSGATIMGGMIFGLDRRSATEFSFFLAIPTMFGATFLDLYKSWDFLVAADLPIFVVGFVAAFFSACLAIESLLKFISNHTFVGFAWYRIAFGVLVLGSAYSGLIQW